MDEEDDWRDAGWSIDVLVGEAPIQLVVAKIGEPELWMLQLAATDQPGLLGRLFGRRAVDRSQEVYQVAAVAHEVIAAAGFTDIRWALNAYPDDAESASAPIPPAAA